MVAVVRNRKIRDLVCKLIKLKPYIKVLYLNSCILCELENHSLYPDNFQGSDHFFDVIYRLKWSSEIPAELSKYVAAAVKVSFFLMNLN